MAQKAAAKRYATIFFDLYGTLVDIHTDEGSEDAWTALRNALEQEGARYASNEQLRAQFEREVARVNSNAHGNGNGNENGSELFEPDLLPAYRELLRACWVEASLEQANRMAWTFRQASTTRLEPYAGAQETLQTLQREGHRVVLISNAQASYTRPELEMFGFDKIFDNMILSSDEGVRKPSKELFLRALNREGIDAENALMVGNDETSDIAGASQAGIDSVYLHTDPNTGGPEAPLAAVSLQGADYAGLLDFVRAAEAAEAAEAVEAS